MRRRARRRLGGALLGAVIATMVASSASAKENSVVHRVTIERFAFNPETLELRPGEAVEWVNGDVVPHTATERTRRWDSSKLARNQTFRITLSTVGVVEYFCAYHPHMRGRLVVTAD